MAELNAALDDIQEVVVTRPEFTQDEWEVVGKATDWLRATLKPEVRKELEVEYAKKQAEFQSEMTSETKRMVTEHMLAWQKEQAPLSEDELKTLLSQEYVEFPLRVKDLRGEKKERNFTICELPEVVEKRFIKAAQQFLIPLIEEINAAEFTLDGSMIEQVNSILRKFPSALDAAVKMVTIILDPWEENKAEITEEWVSHNISTPRLSAILNAQMEANKYRDFFLNGLRSWTNLMRK